MKEKLKARVLDLTDDSGVFCTKLLAMMGADVIRVEPPGGDGTRRIGPFYHDSPDAEKSLHWFHFNLNKRSVTLDITSVDGQALFLRLAKTADVIVECFPPGYLAGLGLGYENLRALNPRIIVTSITPFGQTGPYRGYKGCDLIASAMSGVMFQSGDDDTPPVHSSVPLAYNQTGVRATVGTLLAIHYQKRTGSGQHVDVSQQECFAFGEYPYHLAWKALGKVARRGGDAPWIPGHPRRKIFFKCVDGWVAAYPTYWSHMGICLQWMKENGFADEIAETGVESYDPSTGGSQPPGEVMDAVNAIFGKMAAKFPKRYLFEEGQARGVQVAPISSMEEILHDDQLAAREFFLDVEHPELGEKLTYPGTPFRLDHCYTAYDQRAPFIGEHNEEIFRDELGLNDEELCRYRQANVI